MLGTKHFSQMGISSGQESIQLKLPNTSKHVCYPVINGIGEVDEGRRKELHSKIGTYCTMSSCIVRGAYINYSVLDFRQGHQIYPAQD